MSIMAVNTWVELLESSCSDAGITCLDLIIDQAASASPLLPSILSVEPPLVWHSLFDGLPEEGHIDMAPLLVRVDLAIPLQQMWMTGLMQHLHGRGQLLVLASHWPFQTLVEHLGDCMEARTGDGLGLLRFYDPRLFAQLISHGLTPEQKQRWLSPVLFWSWLDRDGAPRYLPGAVEAPGTPGVCEPVELSDSQMDILQCSSEATLLVEAMPGRPNAEQCFQTCFAALLEATAAGVLVDTEREAFVIGRLRNVDVAGQVSTGNRTNA